MDNSGDEKRIEKAQEKACWRKRLLASSAKKPRCDSTSSTAIATATRSSQDRSFFEVMCRFNCRFALSLLFPELVLPETSCPTCVCSGCLLSLFSLRYPNEKENIFHSNELGEGE